MRTTPITPVGLCALILLLCLLAATTATAQTLTATNNVYEDRIEVTWDVTSKAGDLIKIQRAGTLIAVRAWNETFYADFTSDPGTTYLYCVIVSSGGVDGDIACGNGARRINRVTGFEASDELFEDYVSLTWTDRSEIETGYEITRNGTGNVIAMLPANTSVYRDTDALQGVLYSYCVRAIKDSFYSDRECDDGTRAFVTPPANVSATDGQFTNKIQITWVDQSDSEDLYTIYRDEVEIGTVPPDSTLYDDVPPLANQIYTYFVTAKVGTMESVPIADEGMMDGLAPPTDVAASDNVYDDRVEITWSDAADTEDGFIVLRDGEVLDTTAAGAEAYNDFDAAQDVVYNYCVQAIALDDPDLPSTSTQVCANGERAPVLTPTNMAATDDEFEERTELTWTNVSTTVMLFNIYRDGDLISNVPAAMPFFSDRDGFSGVTYDYCVSAVTVVGAPTALLADVSRLIESTYAMQRSGLYTGQEQADENAAETVMRAVSDMVVQAASQGMMAQQSAMMSIAESALTCDAGSRSLAAPTDVAATYEDHEDHVQVTWTDNSNVEDGYEIYRERDAALALGGTVGSYGSVTGFDTGGELSEFSVDLWVKNDGPQSEAGLFSYATSTANNNAILLIDTRNLSIWIDSERVITGVALPDNRWHHLAFQWENTNGTVQLYMDGELVYETTGFEVGATIASGGTLVFGQDQDTLGGGFNGTQSFSGSLNHIKFWDAFRINQSVQNNRWNSLDGTQGALIGYWPLTDGDGSTAGDRKGASQDASLVGHTWAETSAPVAGRNLLDTVSASRATYGDFTGVPGVEYRYTVRAIDDYNESVPGSDDGKRTLLPPIAVQAGDGVSETEVPITWIDESRAEVGYYVYRRDLTESDSTLIATLDANSNSYTDDTAAFGVVYRYSVVAYDDAGASEPGFDNGATLLLPPGDVNASDTYAGEVTITWTDESDLNDGYRILRSDGDEFTVGANATLYEDVTAVAGTTYTYCVEATNGPGASDQGCDTGGIPAAASNVSPDDLINNTTYLESDGGQSHRFGARVAVYGDYAAITASGADRVNFFMFDQATQKWSETDFITGGNTYGEAIAMQSDYVLVGESGINTAWMFKRNGSELEFSQALSGSSPSRFGGAVDIDGDYAIVGDNGWDANVGKAYIFKRSGSTWELQDDITYDGADVDFDPDQFATAVAIDGDYALVGARYDDDNGEDAGAAYIFKRDGTTWTQQSKLLASDGTLGDWFGGAVALHGDVAIIGAIEEHEGNVQNGATGTGKAYFFKREGNTWTEQAIVEPANGNSDDQFGVSVALDGEYAIVGAMFSDAISPNAGASYIYREDGGAWNLVTRVLPGGSEGDEDANQSETFGISVAMQGAHAFIGANGTNGTQAQEGAVYVQPILRVPENVTASDGAYAGRIQIRWEDTNVFEDGYRVYRREDDGTYQLVGTSDIDAELFDDFTADAGGAYTYCVSAYNADNDIFGTELSESIRDCDTGWRPPNGAISGRIAAGAGGATRGATVCLMPDPNGGMLFDGTGGHVRIPHDDAFNFGENDDFTIETWIRYTGTAGTGTGHANVVAMRGDNPDTHPFAMSINRNTPGKIILGRKSLTSSETITSARNDLNDNAWHHVSVVHDGATSTLRMYIDGDLDTSTTYSGLGDTRTDADLYLGRRGVTTEQWFGGQLDEVRIWNRTRTEAEIQADMVARLEGDEAGLVGYWPLDEGTREIAADLTGTSNGVLTDGAFWTPGGGFAACETTDTNGNYAFSNLRYGDEAEISIEPTLTGRSFSPAARTVVLDPNSPVQNQADFTDITSYSVTGVVQFENTTCPVPDVELYLDEEKDNGGLRGQTEVDGTYSMAVTPSVNGSDVRRIRPQFVNPNNPGDTHTFSPAEIAIIADEDKLGVNFIDRKKRVLEGYFGGSCNTDIGTAEVRIFTENGCFDQTYELRGNFSIELPPQPYLVQVLNVSDTIADLETDIVNFFDELGAVPADLTLESDTLMLEYHAPVSVIIDGLDTSCPSGINYVAGTDLLRTLPNVATLQQGETVGLNIRVVEDYGNDTFCNVEKGTLRVFDGIADRPEPVTLVIEDGEAIYGDDVTDEDGSVQIAAGSSYSTAGGTLDLLTGRSVNGVDRSFQKSITAIASIENVDPVTTTEWAIVTGRRARQSTFVSAVTEEFPILILHDPPGSNSYAYMEEGTTMCNSLLSTQMRGRGAGPDLEFNFGFEVTTNAGGMFIEQTVINTGAGASFAIRTIFGRDDTSLNPNDTSYELCVTPTEGWSTPGDMTWVGEDLYVGVALNLIFAKADDLTVDSCELTQQEVLAMDLNLPDPFETTYVYGGSHIEYSLLPALRELEALGQGQVKGELKGEDTTIDILDTITNWENQLLLADRLTEIGLEGKCADVGKREGDLNGFPVAVDCPDDYDPAFEAKNRSFSAGADYEFSEAVDSTTYKDLTVARVYVDGEGHLGAVTQFFKFEQQFFAAFEFRREFVKEETTTETESATVGYVLSDGDTGDYFSVDVGTDPYYGTPVFGIVSGRSSNPWEEGTQQRDGPQIEVSPPVLYVDDADEAGSFEVTLANVSESQERRQYVLGVPGETNIKNLGLTVTGDLLGGERLETFLLESGQAKTINLDVFRAPSAYSYEDVGLFFYPATEYEIWKADPRQDFALSDTAFFSVYFEAPCSDISMQRPREDWIFNATNLAEDGGLGINLWQFAIPVSETDTVATVGFEYRLLGNNLPGGDDNGWRPGGMVSRSTLGDDAESWTTDWLPQQDGAYELRAFTECQIAGPGARVYSPILEGIVDTNAPEVFGTPQPADQILTLGTDIALSFDEEIDCGSVITNGNDTNATLTFTDDSSTIDGVQAVCDGRTLYLSPPSVYDWSQAENRVLEARVLGGDGGVTDAAGNPMESAAAWSFMVQRNIFAWQPANRTVNVQVDTEEHFSAGLVNGRTEAVDWTLAGVPAWLTPSTNGGTLPPGGETTLSFTIADTLTLGTRVDTLRATTDRGDALFYLTVNVQEEVCMPPTWTVDPAAYQYSMAITAQAFMDGVVSEDGSDILAAFVGSELRGVAPIVPQTGGNRVNLLVYSNTAAGETVTFQAFDASACIRYPGAAKTFTFVNGDIIGTDTQPEAINASFEVPQQQIPLAAGWTWFSLNRTPGSTAPASVLSSVVPGSGDIVKSQTAFSLYDAGAGWVGDLGAIAPSSAYQIRLSSANTLIVDGPAVDPMTPITINAGWNWLGYLPQEAMSIADALGSSSDTYTPSEGDVLKSQFAFETYTGGAWVPGTMMMNPGQGYMLMAGSAGELRYPATTSPVLDAGDALVSLSGPVAMAPTDRTLTAEAMLARKEQALAAYRYVPEESERMRAEASPNCPEVIIDAQAFRHSMTVIAEAQFDGQVLTSPDALVWLTDEAGTPRGQGRVQYLPQTGQYRLFLMLYSDAPQGEAFAVHVYDPASDEVVTLDKAMAFKADHRAGTVEEPIVIAAESEAYKAAQAAAELPTEYALDQNYPNPFNPRTLIRYALPESGQVQLVVYDVIGREVLRLVDGDQPAGHHEITFDASRLASGVYLYRIEAGTFKAMKKMVLVR